MNTPPWRMTEAGAPGVEHHMREAVLQAGFVPFCWIKQSEHARYGKPVSDPRSAAKCLGLVRKEHADRGCPMVHTPLVRQQVRKLLYTIRRNHDWRLFITQRTEPWQSETEIALMLRVPDGVPIGPFGTLSWGSRFGRSLHAAIATSAKVGWRKAEWTVARRGSPLDGCVARCDAWWIVNGVQHLDPDPLALDAARPWRPVAPNAPDDNSYLVIRPPPSKADPFGFEWSGAPIYIPYVPESSLCAFSAVREIERRDACHGEARRLTALFTDNGRSPLVGSDMDSLLKLLLDWLVFAGILTAARIALLTWHSFRVWLACALLAENKAPALIQMILRWRSERSLAAYARLNRHRYAALLVDAAGATVSSLRARHLVDQMPVCDYADLMRNGNAVTRETEAAWDAALLDLDNQLDRLPDPLDDDMAPAEAAPAAATDDTVRAAAAPTTADTAVDDAGAAAPPPPQGLFALSRAACYRLGEATLRRYLETAGLSPPLYQSGRLALKRARDLLWQHATSNTERLAAPPAARLTVAAAPAAARLADLAAPARPARDAVRAAQRVGAAALVQQTPPAADTAAVPTPQHTAAAADAPAAPPLAAARPATPDRAPLPPATLTRTSRRRPRAAAAAAEPAPPARTGRRRPRAAAAAADPPQTAARRRLGALLQDAAALVCARGDAAS